VNLLILVIQWAAIYVVIGTLLAAVKDSIDRRALPPAARMGEFEIKLFVLTWPAVLALGVVGAIGRWCAWVVIGLRKDARSAPGDVADPIGGAGVRGGEVCEFRAGIGVYVDDAAPGEVATVVQHGEVELSKPPGVAFHRLQQLYWDRANDRLCAVDTGIPAGLAAAAASESDTVARVILNHQSVDEYA